MKAKRGQAEGLNVAVLVALIALFIVGYIILLPPEERDKLLGEDINDGGGNNGNNGVDTEGDVLLSETPGIVRPFEDESIKHKLAPVDLFVRKEPQTSDIVPSLFVSRNVFSDRMQSVNFVLENKDDIENAVLFFTVKDARGRLVISLNGREIYNNRLNVGELANIALPVSLLGNRNTITFSTSFSLFGSNRYEIEDIKVRKEFDVQNVEASRTFVLSQDELNRITRAKLNYFISCMSPGRETTDLRIELNDRPFQRIVIPCVGDEVSFEIDEDDLQEGRNMLKFAINNGDFRFTDMEIELELDEKVFPTYNFVVDDDQIDDIRDDNVDAIFKMNFLDDKKRKEAQIFINGNRLFLDTTSDVYSKDVSSFLEDGSNQLKIIPTSQFEILNLEIRLE